MVIESLPRSFFDADRRTAPAGISAIDLMQVSATITASDGVPLASDRADEELNTLADGTPRDYEYRSYDKPTHEVNETSSRFPNGHPHELPISGLEEKRFHEHYRSLVRTMITVRHAYILQSENPDVTRQLNAREMHDVLAGLMFLPQYLVLRGQRSHKAQGTFHPSVTILSNAASGSLGAIQGWVNLQKKNGIERAQALEMVPDQNLMIKQVEEEKGMIGRKTLCPVRPPRQRQFLASVKDGTSVIDARNDTFDVTTILGMHEVPNVAMFGNAAYVAKGTFDIFAELDKEVAAEVRKDLDKGRNRRIKQAIARFRATAVEHNAKLTQYQMQMNKALGRDTQVGVTLDSFEVMGFEMPRLMRDLKEQDKGRGIIYPLLPKQTGVAIPVSFQPRTNR